VLKLPRASRTAVRIGRALALVLTLSSVFGAGCYSPKIGDHTLSWGAVLGLLPFGIVLASRRRKNGASTG